MSWNWELPNWPRFSFDPSRLEGMEKQFLMGVGSSLAFVKSIEETDYHKYVVEILSTEGVESFKIEGEFLDRESLQSSIKKHFGLDGKKNSERETQVAKLLLNVYETFDAPLTHEMFYEWYNILFQNQARVAERGSYRSHPEPMQIVSNRYGSPNVFFEAPPSSRVFKEMTHFIKWFNSSRDSGSILSRAAVAHIYFESIHPFEDGNGRIGRILVEKVLSQGVGRPVLIAVSKILEKGKREYYFQLGKCNKTLDIQDWVEYFAQIILEAQKESVGLLYFLIKKTRLLSTLSGQINKRQEKVLLRLFAEGPAGFKGGLSADNYIKITGASRATATRDLADLVKRKALIKTGELRHSRYWLSSEQF